MAALVIVCRSCRRHTHLHGKYSTCPGVKPDAGYHQNDADGPRRNRAIRPALAGRVHGGLPLRRAGERPRDAVAAAALLLVTAAVFGQTALFGFTTLDDAIYVAKNPHLASGLTWAALRWALTATYASNWHPLTWVSHLADVQLFGLRAGAHHVTNMLFHAVTVVLLFRVLSALTGARWRSAAVAALFAVHPLHVESVAWVAERKDVLAGLFWVADPRGVSAPSPAARPGRISRGARLVPARTDGEACPRHPAVRAAAPGLVAARPAARRAGRGLARTRPGCCSKKSRSWRRRSARA